MNYESNGVREARRCTDPTNEQAREYFNGLKQCGCSKMEITLKDLIRILTEYTGDDDGYLTSGDTLVFNDFIVGNRCATIRIHVNMFYRP